MTSSDEPAGGAPHPKLQKVMARSGFASRRVCEEFIEDGRVTVNGEVAETGRRIDPETDRVEVDGARLAVAPGLVHYLLHKPAGVVSTASDPEGRRTVLDLVPVEPRVFPVGRLDFHTEGLLILTNDGDLTHRLTHPSFGIEKEYLVAVEGVPTRAELRRLREGVELDDGMTAPAQVAQPSDHMLKLTIHEGRNRQVRRMCEAIGHPVLRLVRIRIGPITDRVLKAGEWRLLTADEVRSLDVAITPADAAGAAEPAETDPGDR